VDLDESVLWSEPYGQDQVNKPVMYVIGRWYQKGFSLQDQKDFVTDELVADSQRLVDMLVRINTRQVHTAKDCKFLK